MIIKLTAEQEKFHQEFKYCGAKHREFRNKCIGMLPRILEERIYEKKGFDSIGKYAGKLAGLSNAQVGRALGLHKNFADKPALKKLLENGEAGLSKLARVASIATKDNQDFLANQVMLLPQKALEVMAKDMRTARTAEQHTNQLFLNPDGLPEPQIDPNVVRAHNSRQDLQVENETATGPQMASPLELTKLKLSTQNLEKLLELQGKGIDINQIIASMLASREEEIAQEKANLSAQAKPTKSRYFKVGIKKLFTKEHGDRCAKPGCRKPATQIHHTDRFAMSAIHDPRFMAPLCAQHHQIAHAVDVKYQQKRQL